MFLWCVVVGPRAGNISTPPPKKKNRKRMKSIRPRHNVNGDGGAIIVNVEQGGSIVQYMHKIIE